MTAAAARGYPLKRPLDLAVAGTAALVLALPALVVAAMVRLAMGSPVVFRQERVGLNERVFTVFKFRTMQQTHDAAGRPLPDQARLTRLGRLLRRTSLDELPQILNVLKGDMSLVGPRPLFVEYLPFYTSRERARHSVRPGVTGLAQVSGRNLLGWDERLELDVRYVERCSLRLDCAILLRTVAKVISGADIVAAPGTVLQRLDRVRRPTETPQDPT